MIIQSLSATEKRAAKNKISSFRISGYCYSTEDHKLDVALFVDGQKMKCNITRKPETGLLGKNISTYTEAGVLIEGSVLCTKVNDITIEIIDTVSKEKLSIALPSIKTTLGNYVFYTSRMRKILPYIRKFGFKQALSHTLKLVSANRNGNLPQPTEEQATKEHILTRPLPTEHVSRLKRKVLIIAEMSIPQCKYYRVEQKMKMLRDAGIDVEADSWTNRLSCLNCLQTATLVIFYRVPFQNDVFELYAEARRLGLKIGFDIDDLVFDIKEYSNNPNLKKLPPDVQKSLIDGALMYQGSLKAADFTISSTKALQEFMLKYNPGKSYIIPNALIRDDKVISCDDAAKSPDATPAEYPLGRNNDEIIIGYGSGTSTHDRDFEICSDAVLEIMEEFPNVYLTIHGLLELPEGFGKFKERIHRVNFIPFAEYSNALKRFDINLIPLERNLFNDCKSNIKYIEASRHAVASVASPCAEFSSVIEHAENGFLASSKEEWGDALRKLVVNPELRRKTGKAACETVFRLYESSAIYKSSFSKIIDEQNPSNVEKEKKKRILVVNILYPPMSFGGATIVTENIVREYKKYADVAVFCGTMEIRHHPGFMMRYDIDDVPVFAYEMNPPSDPNKNYSNPSIVDAFELLLKSFEPDIVHFHSIQFLGAEMAGCCAERDIPYIVTLHDAWWICERQFMLDGNNKFCHQDERGIDLYRCSECTKSKELFLRWKFLTSHLNGALAALAPSDYHRDLYRKSNFSAELVTTNRNGIIIPSSNEPHKACATLTFAYLGGKCEHKGYYFLQRVVKRLKGDYKIKLLDLDLKFGNRSIDVSEWPEPSKMECCVPFNHNEMDNFYKDIDVLLFPSCLKESFGLTVREALVRNIWVISTDAGGDLKNDLIEGENGNMVPLYDEEGFANAMQKLIDNPELLANYVNIHRNKIISVETQVKEITEILKSKGFDFSV